MRLLHAKRLEFTDFREDNDRPKYVIASHRWHEESEVTFQDVQNRRNMDKDGYKKIEAFATYIRDYIPSVEWLWIDTCCIDKTNAVELSEAINLMFKWYRNADVCLAYLADVEAVEERAQLGNSKWFQRGWTLQELLAPRTVVFLTKDWEIIGNKGASQRQYSGTPVGRGLEREIATITGVPERVLYDYDISRSVSVDEKLKWMEGRSTTRPEDLSYALYGICGVKPGANYGEEYEGARQRLLTAINYQDNLAAQQAERFRKIVDWLSPANPWTNHNSARNLHEPQTGTWLLESDQYRRWKSAITRHLWMYGKAGSGKTILCSTAIEDIKEHCKHYANAAYAIFYCSFSDNKKQRHTDLLRSLVAQLGWKGPALSMLQEAYDKPNRSSLGLEELGKILLLCFEAYDEVFLLIDALDECPEGEDVRHGMLECLAGLSQRARCVKILATSRELPNIRTSMAALGSEAIPLATRSVDADIQQYVSKGLLRDHRLSRLDSKTKTLIKETISAKADGMFRWAYCQVQELKKLKVTRPSVITKALSSLSATLDETYERILVGIELETRPDALKLLRWLTYAKSPPSLSELVDATIIDLKAEGSVEVNDRPGLDDILEVLSGLVIAIGVDRNSDDLDTEEDAESKGQEGEDDQIKLASRRQQVDRDTKVRLAHFSVKEYLESKRILKSKAGDFYLESSREHGILSQSCLIYLMHYSNSKEKLSTSHDLITFPLLRYSAESWFYHSALQEAGTVTCAVPFLRNDTALRDWLRVHQPDRTWEISFDKLKDIGSSLYYASFVDLERVVCDLIVIGADVNARGGYYNNALQAASVRGHDKVAQMLLDVGADVNAQGGRYGNALQAASFKGHEKVVQILLDAGADVNAQGGYPGNALQAASEGDHEKVVQMLLDVGADVNAQGGHFGNALQAASFEGYEEVVQMLLGAGADINAKGGHFGNALQAVSVEGYDKVVQMLLHAGVDVNAQGGRYGNALQAASFKGHEKIVQMLLDAGADVNAQGGHFGNVLRAASFEGHEKVVQMLLDAGADVDPQKWDCSSALQAASVRGHDKVVEMLLDAGADVDAWGDDGNALQAASKGGYEKVVETLIDAGADVNAPGGHFGNALQLASFECHEKVVQMLLDAGADINPQERYLHVSTRWLSWKNSEKGAQMLRSSGATGSSNRSDGQ